MECSGMWQMWTFRVHHAYGYLCQHLDSHNTHSRVQVNVGRYEQRQQSVLCSVAVHRRKCKPKNASPPAAAWISRLLFVCKGIAWCSARWAVMKTVGMVAACSRVTSGGTGTSRSPAANTCDPKEPPTCPNTCWPAGKAHGLLYLMSFRSCMSYIHSIVLHVP